MEYFDYESAAREAKLTSHQLEALRQAVRRDFPKDLMLYELHLLRACHAIRDGLVTVEQAAAPDREVTT